MTRQVSGRNLQSINCGGRIEGNNHLWLEGGKIRLQSMK